MRYTFLAAHCVQGIAHPIGEPDLVLFDDRAKGIRVLLTGDAIPHLYLLNRHMALLSMMLRAMIGNPLAGDFSELLIRETAQVERQRLDSIGSDPVIIVEINRSVEAQIPANAREIQRRMKAPSGAMRLRLIAPYARYVLRADGPRLELKRWASP